jgi:predicted ferric reductase
VSSQLIWYVARAGGLVAWGLAAAAVLWGLLLSTRVFGRRPRPAWLFDLHRFLGGATVIFTVVHVLAILLDGYVHFGFLEVLVPFTGTWHPVAVAWGIVAMYLLVAVELTSLARTRVSTRIWRRVHYASFAMFAFGSIHAISAGTDASGGVYRMVVLGVCALALVLTAVRVAGRGRVPDRAGSRLRAQVS